MSVILDTHVFFWWITDDPRLEPRHKQIIEARQETVYVSAVSGWEIGIKVRLGKWPEAAVLLPGLTEKVRGEGFEVLDLTPVASGAGGSARADPQGPIRPAARRPIPRAWGENCYDLSGTAAPGMRDRLGSITPTASALAKLEAVRA